MQNSVTLVSFPTVYPALVLATIWRRIRGQEFLPCDLMMSTSAIDLASTNRAHTLSSRAVTGIIVISALLVAITAWVYISPRSGLAGHLLRQLSMGGENNVGAWWSGAILFLGALYCLDGAFSTTVSARSRRGWTAFALIMLALSFDELSSLHEFIASDGLKNLVPIGSLCVLFFFFAVHQLISGGTSKHTIVPVLIAFSLFATVPLQEYFQHAIEWNSRIVYGVRAAIEEGTEICAAIMLLVAIAKNNRGGLLRPTMHDIVLNPSFRRMILLISVLSIPPTVAGSFILPHPGGPADWLASAIFLLCAVTAYRAASIENQGINRSAIMLAIVYVCASAMSSAIRLKYQIDLPNLQLSMRAIFFAVLILGSIPLLRRAGRYPPIVLMVVSAGLLLLEGMRPEAQVVWRSVPALVAVAYFWIESRALVEANRAPSKSAQLVG